MLITIQDQTNLKQNELMNRSFGLGPTNVRCRLCKCCVTFMYMSAKDSLVIEPHRRSIHKHALNEWVGKLSYAIIVSKTLYQISLSHK